MDGIGKSYIVRIHNVIMREMIDRTSVYLSRGMYAKIDSKYYEFVKKISWQMYDDVNACPRSNRNEFKQPCSLKLANYIYEKEYNCKIDKTMFVHHINNNRLDCRIENMVLIPRKNKKKVLEELKLLV